VSNDAQTENTQIFSRRLDLLIFGPI
jgi:hypothetical protein